MWMPGFGAEASLTHPSAARRHYRQSVVAGGPFSGALRPQQSSCAEIVCNDGSQSTGEYPNCECPSQDRCGGITCPDGSTSTGQYPNCVRPVVPGARTPCAGTEARARAATRIVPARHSPAAATSSVRIKRSARARIPDAPARPIRRSTRRGQPAQPTGYVPLGSFRMANGRPAAASPTMFRTLVREPRPRIRSTYLSIPASAAPPCAINFSCAATLGRRHKKKKADGIWTSAMTASVIAVSDGAAIQRSW